MHASATKVTLSKVRSRAFHQGRRSSSRPPILRLLEPSFTARGRAVAPTGSGSDRLSLSFEPPRGADLRHATLARVKLQESVAALHAIVATGASALSWPECR